MGLSLTGYLSGIIGLERPDLFKNIAMQSMAFFDEQYGIPYSDIPTTYNNAPPSSDLKFWMCCGTYERWGDDNNLSEDVTRVAEFFLNKGWNVSLNFHPESHQFPFWVHTMDELLNYFFPSSFIPPAKTSTSTTTTTTPTSTESTSIPTSTYLLPVLFVLLLTALFKRKLKRKNDRFE
jgi:hypothetical protein